MLYLSIYLSIYLPYYDFGVQSLTEVKVVELVVVLHDLFILLSIQVIESSNVLVTNHLAQQMKAENEIYYDYHCIISSSSHSNTQFMIRVSSESN